MIDYCYPAVNNVLRYDVYNVVGSYKYGMMNDTNNGGWIVSTTYFTDEYCTQNAQATEVFTDTACSCSVKDTYNAYGQYQQIGRNLITQFTDTIDKGNMWSREFLLSKLSAVGSYEDLSLYGYYVSVFGPDNSFCYQEQGPGAVIQGFAFIQWMCVPDLFYKDPTYLSGVSSSFVCNYDSNVNSTLSTYQRTYDPSLDCGYTWNSNVRSISTNLIESSSGPDNTAPNTECTFSSPAPLTVFTAGNYVSGSCYTYAPPAGSPTKAPSYYDDDYYSYSRSSRSLGAGWIVLIVFGSIFASLYLSAMCIAFAGRLTKITTNRIEGVGLAVDDSGRPHNGGLPQGLPTENPLRGDPIPSPGRAGGASVPWFNVDDTRMEEWLRQQQQACPPPPSYTEATKGGYPTASAPSAPIATAVEAGYSAGSYEVNMVEAHVMRPSEEVRYADDFEATRGWRAGPPGTTKAKSYA
jgi:hypothetical protein